MVSFACGKVNGGSDDEARKGNKRTAGPRFSDDCAIETHEILACRALALGRGDHLADLGRCWSEQQNPITKVVRREEGMDF